MLKDIFIFGSSECNIHQIATSTNAKLKVIHLLITQEKYLDDLIQIERILRESHSCNKRIMVSASVENTLPIILLFDIYKKIGRKYPETYMLYLPERESVNRAICKREIEIHDVQESEVREIEKRIKKSAFSLSVASGYLNVLSGVFRINADKSINEVQLHVDQAIAIDSPIKSLLSSVIASILNTIPEGKRQDQDALLKKIKFTLTDLPSKGVFPGYRLERRNFGEYNEIRASLKTFEHFWCVTNYFVTILLLHQPSENQVLQIGPDEAKLAAELVNWSYDNISTASPLEWPSHFPKPNITSEISSLVEQHFYAACGWALQHEFGHVVKDHKVVSKEVEIEADRFATESMLLGQKSEEVSARMSMGPAIAIFILVMQSCLLKKNDTLTHPKATSRLISAMEILNEPNHYVLYLLSLVLRVTMTRFQIPLPEYTGAQNLLEMLQRHCDAIDKWVDEPLKPTAT